MIHYKDKYAKGKYGIPNRDDEKISPEEKDSRKYNLEAARGFYHEFCKGGTFITSDEYDSVSEYRSYAYGNQDQAKYKNSYYGSEKDSTVSEALSEASTRKLKRKASENLNFTIQSPAPRMMDALIGKMSDMINLVSVDPSDQYSGAVKETAKWGAWVDKAYRKEFRALTALMSIPEQEQGFVPENMEELNLYEAEGGFKPAYAETMERLLKYSFEQSNWDETIVEKILFDLITNGFTAVEDVYDKGTGQVRAEYLDAETVGVQYTQETSYKSPDYGFYIKTEKVSNLRKMGFKDDELNSAAEKFANYYGNDKYEDPNSVNKDYQYSSQADKFTVPVFVVYWIDVDYKKEISHENRYGKKRTRPYDKKAKLGKKDEVITTRVKTVRQVHWVIDTEMIYKYGRCEHQVRDGLAEPRIPIHMVKVMGKPLIPRLVPAFDLYMNSWMRFQQGIRMAAMNGFAIDMAILNNINLGNRKMNPRDVIKAWKETGILLFSSENINGMRNQGGTRPIEQLPGGAGLVMTEAVQGMDLAMRQMEELTGINPLTLGSQPTPEQGKAVTEFSIVGTSDILKNIVKKANMLKSDVARNMCLRLQYVSKKDIAEKAYKDVIGESSLKLLQYAEGHDVKYGIRTHARPTAQDISDMKQTLALSLKNGRDGKVGITEAEYLRFTYMVNAGESLKRVAMLLGSAHRKAQKEAEERAMRAQQLDQQGAQQLAAQKAQIEQQQQVTKSQGIIAEENVKGRNEVINKAVENKELSWREALEIMGVPVQEAPQQPQIQGQQPEVPVPESNVPQTEEAI